MFRRVLIANRGEIALRVMRTCERLGIETVAVYSDADRGALHASQATQALRIGPPPAPESYLNIEAIIDAAQRAGADAVHPGYGFLSENAAFAEACAAAGLTFIGPPPAAMRLLGDKTAARQLAVEHDVPVVPGIDVSQDAGAMTDAAAKLGFPLMVKAAAGGGGRGMRLVASPEELADALAGASREATAAFGDGRLFVERAITGGRHIEVQVLLDRHGHAVHLGERDCSVQRRHQKVIEESPAPGIDDALRERLTSAALRVACAAGYENAGTVEFLVDRDGGFYFLEVNARLQVEHPVTELVTGHDLVELQLRIAAREPLPFAQDGVRLAGHAIECRIYAEEPQRDYLPSSGRITYFAALEDGTVRVDAGVASGSTVPAEYDPLLAKLIVHAPARAEAVDGCVAALRSVAVEGVKTNLGLLEAVLTHPSFAEGAHDIGLLDAMAPGAFASQLPDDVLLAAVAADAGPLEQARGGDPWQRLGAWRAGAPARLAYAYHGRTFEAQALRNSAASHRWRVTVEDRAHDVALAQGDADEVVVTRDGVDARWHVRRERDHLILTSASGRYILARPALPPPSETSRAHAGRSGEMRAPMPGVVARVLVAEGDRVAARQPLVVVEAMKIEHIVESSIDGVVRSVRCQPGQRVAEGEILVEVTSDIERTHGSS